LLGVKYGLRFLQRAKGLPKEDKELFDKLVYSARSKARISGHASFHNMRIRTAYVHLHWGRYILYEVKGPKHDEFLKLLYLGHVLYEEGTLRFDFEKK
jgi:hypothetical protein